MTSFLSFDFFCVLPGLGYPNQKESTTCMWCWMQVLLWVLVVSFLFLKHSQTTGSVPSHQFTFKRGCYILMKSKEKLFTLPVKVSPESTWSQMDLAPACVKNLSLLSSLTLSGVVWKSPQTGLRWEEANVRFCLEALLLIVTSRPRPILHYISTSNLFKFQVK